MPVDEPSQVVRARPSAKDKSRWNKHATRFVKLAMTQHNEEGASFKELAALLSKDDPNINDTAAALTKRVNRGTLPFAYALHLLRLLGVNNLDISHIKTNAQLNESERKKDKK